MTTPARRIVVGTDGSHGARSALAWAADEAVLRHCDLLLAYAPHIDARIVAKLGEPLIHAVDEFGRNLLDQATAEAAQRQPGLAVDTVLSHDSAADALVDLSVGSELVVVGSRGSDEATGTMIGSVSHRVATHAGCPVGIVPAHIAYTSDHGSAVVAGVSESDLGRRAAHVAAGEAQLRGLGLRLVHGCDDPDSQEHVDDVAHDVRHSHPGLQVDVQAVPADPVDTLYAASRDARLLVLGCHRSSDRWSRRLGLVPSQLIHRVECPVLLVSG
jgi:nucleotide-binding universal stress UspA family protein